LERRNEYLFSAAAETEKKALLGLLEISQIVDEVLM
jgi:hypothetical protein